MQPAILALDIGTSAVKGSVFDIDGRMLTSHQEEYILDTPRLDIVELNPEIYWESAQRVIRSILAQIAEKRIVGIGVTSQGETLITVDKNGRVLYPAIVWLDNRSISEAAEIAEHWPLDKIYRITGQPEVLPTWTAAKIAWLKKHEPDMFRQIDKFLLVEDYLIYKLTGEYVTDRGLVGSTLYFDIRSGEWWQEMLDFLEVKLERLPLLLDSGQVAGKVTSDVAEQIGLISGTPVVACAMDQVASAVGAGNVEEGIVTETTGSALAVCATSTGPIYDAQRRFPCQTHAIPGKYIALPWTATGGMAFRWFRDVFGSEEVQAARAASQDPYHILCQEAESVPPGSEGLLTLPFLSGAGSPFFNPKARGIFSGFGLNHTKAHFVRSILESVGFILRQNIEMLEEQGYVVHEIRSLGGGARSDLWLQIKADILKKPIVTLQTQEAASQGAAIMVGNALKIHNSIQEGCTKICRVGRGVSPDEENEKIYDASFQLYCQLCDTLRYSIWR